jgi:hypothetical protein
MKREDLNGTIRTEKPSILEEVGLVVDTASLLAQCPEAVGQVKALADAGVAGQDHAMGDIAMWISEMSCDLLIDLGEDLRITGPNVEGLHLYEQVPVGDDERLDDGTRRRNWIRKGVLPERCKIGRLVLLNQREKKERVARNEVRIAEGRLMTVGLQC